SRARGRRRRVAGGGGPAGRGRPRRRRGRPVRRGGVRPTVARGVRRGGGRGLSFPITASFGVAALDPDGDPESLLRRCDRALYQAKRAGRDRVVVFDPAVDTAVIRLTPRNPAAPPRTPA